MRQITREEQQKATVLASWLVGCGGSEETQEAAHTILGLAVGELVAVLPEDNQGLAGDGI